MFAEMDEESKVEYIYKQKKLIDKQMKEEKTLKEYHQHLENDTLQTFNDVPDEVTNIYVCNCSSDWVSFEWDPPEDNNSKILGYRIYIS